MNRSFEKVPIESSSSEVDYIIVGGGSAGCVIAYRLLEAGYSVAVIEASGDNKDVKEVKNPSDYYKLYGFDLPFISYKFNNSYSVILSLKHLEQHLSQHSM
jgi:choline dehydrogenase-like flavoprotein